MKTENLKKKTTFEELEAFEPDLEFSDELQACGCLCGFASGAGSGPAGVDDPDN